MEVEIENVSTEVVFTEGEMPLDERQLEMIVSKVAEKIQWMHEAAGERQGLTELDPHSPSFQKLQEH